MAFAAQLAALTDELVEAVASSVQQSDPAKVGLLRDSSLRKLRQHSFLRTDQFQVEDNLNGLEERLRVLNRDTLADSLRDSRDALSHVSNRFTPEMLSLLLLLSDQPVQKTRLQDLDALRSSGQEIEAPLRWDDIAKEDGWTEDPELWNNVDFADDSSDDLLVDDKSDASDESEQTSLSSIEAQHRRRPLDLVVDSQDEECLDRVKETQSWRSGLRSQGSTKPPSKIVLSELQAFREVLFMLRGCETTTFNKQNLPLPNFYIHHASSDSFQQMLRSFGELGRHLALLRGFVKGTETIPLLQVFQAAIERRLHTFDRQLSNTESLYVDIKSDVVVSLMRLLDDIERSLQPLASLSSIVQKLDLTSSSKPFHYLELLYDHTITAQMEGDEDTYAYLGTIFFECFKVYVRPIRRWMDEGELSNDDNTFFVVKAPSRVPLQRVWQDQFVLRRASDGTLHAPSFLHPAASRIFTTGKSVVVLKMLRRYNSNRERASEPSLAFDPGCVVGPGSFAPFSELFAAAFKTWMQSKHHTASTILRQVLFESTKLLSTLDALHNVYLMVDGSRAETFASGIYNNMDLLNPRWYDCFSLTGLAHEAYGSIIDTHQISVHVPHEVADQDEVSETRRSVWKGLPFVRLHFSLPWPVRIIVSDESLAQYQAVFTLLLQIRRALHVLRLHKLQADEKRTDVAGLPKGAVAVRAAYYDVRARLLWFCTALHTYLAGQVFSPLASELHGHLASAENVDGMIAEHAAFARRLVDQACLGSKLEPIHHCILEVLDLAVQLEDARQLDEEERQQQPRDEQVPEPQAAPAVAQPLQTITEEEDATFLSEQQEGGSILFGGGYEDGEDGYGEGHSSGERKSYLEVVREIRAGFDRHLKFACGGLRGVARASATPRPQRNGTLWRRRSRPESATHQRGHLEG